MFIDADKVGYVHYWDLLVPRVRQGGLLLADNTLYYGEAADEQPEGNAAAIDAFNKFVLRRPARRLRARADRGRSDDGPQEVRL